jgi:hypothetical protein
MAAHAPEILILKGERQGMLSPVEFERQQILKAEGVQKSRGYSP